MMISKWLANFPSPRIILFLFFFLAGFAGSFISGSKTVRILAITEREFLGDGENSWPKQLEGILNRNTQNRSFIVAAPQLGANSSVIVSQIESAITQYRPQIIIAMLGINDAHAPMTENTPLPPASSPDNNSPTPKLDKPTNTKEDSQMDFELSSKIPDDRVLFYKQIIQSDPKRVKAYVGLGTLYVVQGKYKEAEIILRKALKQDSNNEDAYFQLGLIYCYQEKFNESEEALQNVLRINPDNTEAYVELGRLYKNFRLFDQATQMFQKAISLNPDHQRAHYEFGNLLFDQKRLDKAETMYVEAITINPNSPEGHLGLGRLYRLLGRLPEAETSLTKVLSLTKQPQTTAMTLEELSYLYRQMGEPEKATLAEDKLSIMMPTTTNLRQLYTTLSNRGISLVFVGYPMRTIENTQKLLDQSKGITYVESQESFKTASDYEAYFSDRAFGDFGHLTDKGNILFAQIVADALLRL